MEYDKGEAVRQRIVQLIRERDETHGVAPTYQNIADQLGMSLTNIAYHVKVLERAGILERVPGAHRALRVKA